MNFRAIRMYEDLGFKIDQRTPQRSFWKPNSEGGKIAMRKVIADTKVIR
jgi:ribosomal protein S18 acetylase RimI-like enzyme